MTHKDYIEELAAGGDLDNAIKEFLRGAKILGGRIYNDAISISGRYNGLKNDMDKGVLPPDFFERKKNGIRNALLSMLEDYEPSETITFTKPN
ncbi:MAG: hypothetical protein AAGG75_21605 [Bacteroidota bacterium]